MRKALVTGATGFLGRNLIARLDSPRILSRNPDRARGLGDVEAFGWDAISGEPPLEAFQDVDVLFHLAGDGISEFLFVLTPLKIVGATGVPVRPVAVVK